MPASAQRILFAINPRSGGNKKGAIEKLIRAYFKNSKHTVEFYVLGDDSDSASMDYWITNWKPDKVVAVGGDGTVKHTAELLLNKQMPLGILPAGSANGMAKELDLPKVLEDCLDIILNAEPRSIDIIRINGKEICLHLADLGLNAQLVKYHDERSVRGKWGYFRGVLKMMMNKRSLPLRIITDTTEINTVAFMLVIANAQRYGTGAIINPDGDLSDGQFELVIMKKISFWAILKMWWNPKRIAHQNVEWVRTTRAEIHSERKAYFQVDGEFRGSCRHVSAQIELGSLLLLFKPVITV